MSSASTSIETDLRLARVLYEKCELEEAHAILLNVLPRARKLKDKRFLMDALSALLRIAGEAMDPTEVSRWDGELDALMKQSPDAIPPMAWYCKASIARHNGDLKSFTHLTQKYLRAVKAESKTGAFGQDHQELLAKGWTTLALILEAKGKLARSQLMSEALIRRYEAESVRGVVGILYMNMGKIAAHRGDLPLATSWYQRAHERFMAERNWYYYLHVLLEYARLARISLNFAQAYWYLDLVERTASSPKLGGIRAAVKAERELLKSDAVDLMIDSPRAEIQTREGGTVSLGKQYVLLHILEALSKAHEARGDGADLGLSKAEIIEKVWRERYRPAAHDNKLYYNINRLRKLIEPDMSQPKYLLNWREGYRLAPGLKIQWIKDKRT